MVIKLADSTEQEAKLEHLLACIYAEFATLGTTDPPKRPVTREEIYLDHD